MLLTAFRGKEGAVYERPLRGMTPSQMREIIRGAILDGHDENREDGRIPDEELDFIVEILAELESE